MDFLEQEVKNNNLKTNDMNSIHIKRIVDNYQGFDISKNTNKDEYVLSRWIFFRLCKIYTKEDYGYFANKVNRGRCSVYHALKNYDNTIKSNTQFLKWHNEINSIVANKIGTKTNEIETVESVKNTYGFIINEKEECIIALKKLLIKKDGHIITKLKSLPKEVLNELFLYKIKPHLRMLESRKMEYKQ